MKNFTIQRRSKIIIKELPLIFGVSGVARAGKDTFAKYLSSKLERMTLPHVISSFAQNLKQSLDPLTKEMFNISAFTEKEDEKKLLRPLFVALGTDVARKYDKDFWVKRIEKKVTSCLNNNIITIIPDVRYENEVKWIKSLGGIVIHITRMGTKPANFEERANNPIIKKLADYKINWKNFKDEKETCTYHVNKFFYDNGWSTYGQFNGLGVNSEYSREH